MTMLYKATQGVVKESHYGLALARIVPLPSRVIERATFVAQALEHHRLHKKKTSETVLKEKRRKLILNLKEHLIQAQTGVLDGEVLTAWLKELQKEFINRMVALEAEAANAGQETDSEDVEMREGGEYDEKRPSTYDSQPSVMTIDSHSLSIASESPYRAISEASTLRAVSDNER